MMIWLSSPYTTSIHFFKKYFDNIHAGFNLWKNIGIQPGIYLSMVDKTRPSNVYMCIYSSLSWISKKDKNCKRNIVIMFTFVIIILARVLLAMLFNFGWCSLHDIISAVDNQILET